MAPIYFANTPSRLALVDAGLARSVRCLAGGRKATLRYARYGQVIGLPSVIVGSSPEGAEPGTAPAGLASSDGESLFVEIEHQELADMIGTVREVVSRTLRQLQDEGLVRRNGHRVTLLDTDRLSRGL